MSDSGASLGDFNGVARLFPLPNLVLFPHVVQPLHIFEPRYRQMTRDALASDHLIAVVLLKPAWEEDYEGRPPIHPVACLGRIITEQRLPDGKYNLLLRGMCRLRLENELTDAHPYRSASGWALPDPLEAETAGLRKLVVQHAEMWLPAAGASAGQFRALLDSQLPLGALCDILSFALPLAVEVKQSLLEELDIEHRARRLVETLDATPPPEQLPPPKEQRKFPPDFSSN